LRELLRAHGAAVCDDKERVAHWLRYACPDCKHEISLLLAALDVRVPHDLIRAGATWRLAFEPLISRLIQERCLSREAASWAVEAWADAVNSVSGQECSDAICSARPAGNGAGHAPSLSQHESDECRPICPQESLIGESHEPTVTDAIDRIDVGGLVDAVKQVI